MPRPPPTPNYHVEVGDNDRNADDHGTGHGNDDSIDVFLSFLTISFGKLKLYTCCMVFLLL